MTRAMKVSGVTWIGEIPQGWEIRRFKDAGRFQTGKDHKALNEGYIPVYGSSREPFAFVDRALCKRKAIAIGRKGTVDQPFVIQAGFWAVDTCMFNTALKKNFSLEYLGYWAEIVPWREMSTQTALPSLTQTDANNAIVGYPPLIEQLAIADYLDRQTALIDQRLTTLAEKKTVLAELRKATIHEAVTKGLNKTAPMKDSCVAWIGTVPSHWTRLRIKDVSRDYLGQAEKDAGNYVGLEHITPWLGTYQAADRAEAAASTGQFISEGVVCFSKLRPYLAKAFVAKESLFVTTELLTFVPRRAVVDARFLTRYLLTHGFIAEVNDAVAGTKMPRVDWHTLATRIIFLPPISEQLAIADHLDQQIQQFDAQLATLDEQAQILKWLRKAIIHEAVTGKIDLSGYTPQPRQAIAA